MNPAYFRFLAKTKIAAIAVLALAGCATDHPLVSICAIQPLGAQGGVAIVRMQCEAEGERI